MYAVAAKHLGVEKGLLSGMGSGVVAGYPMIDIKVTLLDGAHHEVDSSALAFEIAARSAFNEAILKAKPKLLEPIMRVEVVTPDNYMGDVIGDLHSRRGNVQGMEPGEKSTIISAMVPLATMFGYVNKLRSITQGRAQYSMFFDCYKHVPQMVAAEMQAKLA